MQFPLTITAIFLKKSHARRMFRNVWRLLIAFGLIAVVVVSDLRVGHFGTLSAFGVSAVALCVLIYGAAWIRHVLSINDWVRRQGDAPVVYSLSETTIEAISEIGSTKLKWEAFSSLAISEHDILLKFPRYGALTMPTQQVPNDALEFLKDRFAAHGNKIEDRRRKG